MLVDRGGPKYDIIVNSGDNRNGFLAECEDEYSSIILQILNMSDTERREIREAARSFVDKFSDLSFQEGFLREIAVLLGNLDFLLLFSCKFIFRLNLLLLKKNLHYEIQCRQF